MTRRPSRIVGVTSFSTSPSPCAERKILYSVRDILPSVLANSRRIWSNSGDALSRILPNLSIICEMRCTNSGKVAIPSAKSYKAG